MTGFARSSVCGMLWTAGGRVAVRGMQFVVGIFLARLLTPADFGLVGMLGVFIGVSEMFVDCGFPLALVRKVDRTDEDASTVFWFSLGVAAVCYAALFFGASAIAVFFGEPSLALVARVVTTGILFGALTSVPRALLRAQLKFRELSAISIAVIAVSGALGIFFAYRGFGVWALVLQGVIGGVVGLVLTYAVAHWLPGFAFSRASFREFFSFGWKHLVSSIVNAFYYHAYSLVIGRTLGSASVGVYARAHSWASLPPQVVTEAMTSVNYPLLARLQGDNKALRSAYGRLAALSLIVLVPALGLMAAFAEQLVGFVLGSHWLCCVPYIRILVLGLAFEPMMCLYQNMLYLKGRTDVVLKLELLQKPICFGLVFAGIPFGLKGLCVAKAASTMFMAATNFAVARRVAR